MERQESKFIELMPPSILLSSQMRMTSAQSKKLNDKELNGNLS